MPPSRALPRQRSPTDALIARDISCRLTGTVEGTEHAHLVPRTELPALKSSPLMSHATLLLRSDIHTVFDQRRFAITLESLPIVDEDWRCICSLPACLSSLRNSTMVSLCNHCTASRRSTC
ncbi:hypothetical protein KCU66_g56, partial [Aureobasidium melanogenum]